MVSSYSLPFTIQPSDDILLFILNNIWLSLSQGFCHSSVGKESACNAGDLGWIPRLGKSSGEGNGNPLQYSHLENPMDRGAWQSVVHVMARVGHNLETKPLPSPLSFLILSIFFPMPLLDVSNLYNYLFPAYLYSIIFFIHFEVLAQVVNLHGQLASRLSFWQLNWSVLCRLESQDPEREGCLRLLENVVSQFLLIQNNTFNKTCPVSSRLRTQKGFKIQREIEIWGSILRSRFKAKILTIAVTSH